MVFGDDVDDDSLGNLSEFEDADFEAFADSLLEDNADEELFGYDKSALASAPMFRNPPPADLDSLSDFENDDDATHARDGTPHAQDGTTHARDGAGTLHRNGVGYLTMVVSRWVQLGDDL